MVRLALNSVSEECQEFVQSSLGRERLPNWEGMWTSLQQEEMTRDLVKCKLDSSSSSSGVNPKEEDENATSAITSNSSSFPLQIPSAHDMCSDPMWKINYPIPTSTTDVNSSNY